MMRSATAALAATILGLVVATTATGAGRPAAPIITGPTATTPGKHTYVLSSVEKGLAASKLRFRCSLDSTSLRACARRVTLQLGVGRHVLRAQAIDPSGRRSPVARLSISVQAVAPELTVSSVWQKATTSTSLPRGGLFGLAVGADGNVYVSNAADDRVQVYDSAGNLLRSWGSRGKGPGQFRFEDNPDLADSDIPFSGVSIDQRTGDVYVAEPQRVQKFDAQGNFQLGWGTLGIDNGQFTRVADLTVGPTGTVYVMEDRPTMLGRVQKFDPNGSFLTTFGRGQIVDPGGIALDAGGDVLVADDGADNLKLFGADGRLLRTIGEPGNTPGQLAFPTDIALGGNTFYVADQDHFRVVRFDLTTGRPTGYWPSGTAAVVGLAFDGAGGLYVIDEHGVLGRYAVSG